MEVTYKLIDLEENNKELIEFLGTNMEHVFNEETYKWEYFFKPEHTIFTALFDENKIIGTQSFLPYPLIIDNQKTITGKSENSFILNEYRRGMNFYNLYYFGVKECQKLNIKVFWAHTFSKSLAKDIAFQCV